MNIREEIKIHCKELDIKKVDYKFVPKVQGAPLAKYAPEERCIYLLNTNSEVETAFCIAHEMRHVWQNDNHIYPTHIMRELLSVKAYNLQPDEIDANGYAYAYMRVVYGITVTFDGVDKEVVKKIKERALEIIAE